MIIGLLHISLSKQYQLIQSFVKLQSVRNWSSKSVIKPVDGKLSQW